MKNNQKGQSMFEVLIALFMITLIVVSVVSLASFSISNANFSKNKTLSGRLSQEAVEWLRLEREKDSSLFITQATGVYCLDSLLWTNVGSCSDSEVINSVFKREVTFTTSTVSGKNIIDATIVTSWTDSKGYHESKSVTNFSDIREL